MNLYIISGLSLLMGAIWGVAFGAWLVYTQMQSHTNNIVSITVRYIQMIGAFLSDEISREDLERQFLTTRL